MNFDELRASRSAVVTVADAASVLGIDARTVSRAVQNSELPALRVGRRLLIPRLPLLACLGATESHHGVDQTSQDVEGERHESLAAPNGLTDASPSASHPAA